MRPLIWVGSSRKDRRAFPDPVRKTIGFALVRAHEGVKHPSVRPMQGFGGAGVLDAIEDYAGDTYRAVYTVDFPTAVYVLHAFKKKSTRGSATPDRPMQLISTAGRPSAGD